MASFKLYLDKRKKTEGELVPVVIIVSHKNRTTHIPTGVKVLPNEIDMSDTKNNGKVLSGENKARKSSVIASKKTQVQRCLLELREKGVLDKYDVTDIKRYIMSNGVEEKSDCVYFIDKLKEYADNRKNENTKAHYNNTLRLLCQFTDMTKVRFEDINNKFLSDYCSNIQSKGLSVNTIALSLRLIRAVFNSAIDDDITTYYPFRKFKIKTEMTTKRSVPSNVMRDILTMEINNKTLCFYRDLFALTFYLIGINMVDLFNLPVDAIKDGRIEYGRRKTSKPYSIKVEPEAMAIIDKYRGKSALLCMADRYANERVVSCYAAQYLSSIREGLTMYWARHSWASIAFNECEISKDVVSLALGHSNGLAVTSIYINPSLKKIDEANRKVIDFVLYNK